MNIPFNRPHATGREAAYVRQAVESGRLAGNGPFTGRCQALLEARYGFRKCLLTTSCTDALEMAAILTGVGPGDEVIVPSYTFVSSALAFARAGATIVFADSGAGHPNIDAERLESLVTPRTKVVVPVHYAGCACAMDRIMEIAGRHGLFVVEDAAQAIDAFHVGSGGARRPLGSVGHLAAFSFHETKNVVCGEGGLLAVNDARLVRRAEIVWEKGTNRAEFFRGEVNKYGWIDTGSSFLPSELTAAFLLAQLEDIDRIQARRLEVWRRYADALAPLARAGAPFALPSVPPCATNNAHMFYLLFPDLARRSAFIAKMKAQGVSCPFHYLALHSSPFARTHAAQVAADRTDFANCDRYADCLVRLPLYADLSDGDVAAVVDAVRRSS